MKITKIRHAWPERADYVINRPNGAEQYIFLHFWTPINILIDGKMITTSPHACIVFDTVTPQYFTSHEVFTHDWFHITGELPEYMKRYGLEFNKIYYPKSYSFITDIVRDLEFEFVGQKKFHSDMYDCKIKELIMKLSREVDKESEQIQLNPATVELLKKLKTRLCTEYYENWTIEKMAAYIGLSPSYLYASYKSFYQISPLKDLISVRIERAKYLLSTTGDSVQDIAAALGYTNTTHFIRQFSSKVNMSPAQYRKHKTLSTRTIFK